MTTLDQLTSSIFSYVLMYFIIAMRVRLVRILRRGYKKDIMKRDTKLYLMAAMRNRLIHAYFGVDYRIVWDTIESKIPETISSISQILQELKRKENDSKKRRKLNLFDRIVFLLERRTMQPSQSFEIPDDLYYEPTHHLWAKKEPETGRIVVGIDTLGLQASGDLAFLALPEVGTAVKKGEAVGMLEAAKMTSELRTPVSGIVIGRNDKALKDPHLVNQKPYDDGWLFSIDPTEWESEKSELVSGEAIRPWVYTEINRYQEQGQLE
jgi:glycine cleavage system H protein